MPSAGCRCSAACPLHAGTGGVSCQPRGRQEGRAGTRTHDAPAAEMLDKAGVTGCEELVLERNKRGAGRRAMEQHPQCHTVLQGVCLPRSKGMCLSTRIIFSAQPLPTNVRVYIYKYIYMYGATADRPYHSLGGQQSAANAINRQVYF